MTRPTLTDQQADAAARAVLDLAEVIREGDADATLAALDRAVAAAGDAGAALAVAAAMIRVDLPVSRWWQKPRAKAPRRDPLGTGAHIARPGDRRRELERLRDAGVKPATLEQLALTAAALDRARMGRPA